MKQNRKNSNLKKIVQQIGTLENQELLCVFEVCDFYRIFVAY